MKTSRKNGHFLMDTALGSGCKSKKMNKKQGMLSEEQNFIKASEQSVGDASDSNKLGQTSSQ
jgi:hypothetical protein